VILAALRAMNTTQCQPPLSEEEVATIAASCATYPDGTAQQDMPQRRNGQASPGQEPYASREPLSFVPALLSFQELLTLDIPERKRYVEWLPEHSNCIFSPASWSTKKLGVDLILTSEAARTAVEEILHANPHIRVVILDNISCLFSGISEDKKQDWEPINTWLVRLRHRGITVVLVHHVGKEGQQRGTSGREDSLDAVLSIEYPQDYRPEDGCHFHLRFKKSRSIKGEAVAALDVRLEDMPDGPTWTFRPLEESAREWVEQMLNDGMTPGEIVAELDVTRSYVYRIKRDIAKTQETQQ
jgi:hypothetical protein